MMFTRAAILIGVGALAAACPTASIAQAPPPAPGHHSIFSRPGILHRPIVPVGSIIGDRRTRVFHMPGDRGPLPAPRNRVYFRTAAEAMRAGYRPVRRGGRSAPASPPLRRRDPRTGRFLPGGGPPR